MPPAQHNPQPAQFYCILLPVFHLIIAITELEPHSSNVHTSILVVVLSPAPHSAPWKILFTDDDSH